MLTTLKFLADSPRFEYETPYEMFGYPEIPLEQRSNCDYATCNDIWLTDVREYRESLSLEENGFEFRQHQSKCSLSSSHFEMPGDDPSPLVVQYLEETMKEVKDHLGAVKVICFDWRFRRSGFSLDEAVQRSDARRLRQQALPAGLTMYCDYSHEGGDARIKMHLKNEELSEYCTGKQRIKIVNAWRPFEIVYNAPLVIADKKTVHWDDLIEVDKVQPNLVEKAYYVKHRKHQRWFYMSSQSPQDLALFTTWDSHRGIDEKVADWSPHGAASYFDENRKPRESLEVRLIVLFPKGEKV